eukprot:CAMPEP_0203682220 /NCGR_PEP_ID=MMETSP0090-20130426/45111_1 /ASSEMBLY_ACC=CAM_ASM_001088 /TAXON_ID=426623 /ORGANISM="Chaetoceros affinis, Strain CCMP159" /LENGTH=579 /DNA_ID=CAMNT_0050551047 /DNA_START=56 /DNA_END=1795 /DNA_ORIENTATION=+
MTGVYYSFDIPAALHQQLKDYMAKNSSDDDNYAVKFNLLYSVYSIPNIILPFIGGTIVDKLTAHHSAMIFVSLTLIGQILFAIGAQIKSWNVMLLGRVFYGFGGESITVATSTLTSIWFQGKELALAFGINLAVSRMGSVLNNWISPSIANSVSTPFAIWFGVGMNFVSVMSICIIIHLTAIGEKQCSEDCVSQQNGIESLTAALLEDYEGDQNTHMGGSDLNLGDGLHSQEADIQSTLEGMNQRTNNHQTEQGQQEEEILVELEAESRINPFQCIHDIKSFSIMFWILSLSCVFVYGSILPFNNIASGLLLERNYFISPPSSCTLAFPDQCTSGSLAPTEGNPSKDKKGNVCPVRDNLQPVLPQSINIASTENENGWDHDSYEFDHLTTDNVDCGDKFWNTDCTKDYCDAQRRATETSGRIMSIPYILSAILSPFFGHIVDKVGFRALIACLAPVLLIFVHLSLALTDSSPVIPLLGQGLAYTFYAAVIWPSVPLTVDEGSTGTAFGAITAVQNFGLALFPLLIAAIFTASGNAYIPNVEFFFVGCAIVGTFLGFFLNVCDRRNGYILNKVERRIVSV